MPEVDSTHFGMADKDLARGFEPPLILVAAAFPVVVPPTPLPVVPDAAVLDVVSWWSPWKDDWRVMGRIFDCGPVFAAIECCFTEAGSAALPGGRRPGVALAAATEAASCFDDDGAAGAVDRLLV